VAEHLRQEKGERDKKKKKGRERRFRCEGKTKKAGAQTDWIRAGEKKRDEIRERTKDSVSRSRAQEEGGRGVRAQRLERGKKKEKKRTR